MLVRVNAFTDNQKKKNKKKFPLKLFTFARKKEEKREINLKIMSHAVSVMLSGLKYAH